MLVKELERFAYSAWSPASFGPTTLATLTAEEENLSGALDTSTPVLELFQFHPQDPSVELSVKVTVQVTSRATCLCWGTPTASFPLGILISGTAFGGLNLYNPNSVLYSADGTNLNVDDQSSAAAVVVTSRENVHTGVVRCVDSNRFQTNLFASVADEAEILIWDVEKMDQPMSPGNKLQPIEPITTAAWNPRVQHILATASAGHCTIWDLRRSDPVVHLTKAMCQFEPHLMAWSPDVATRLCLADPANPTAEIQLWDLRFPKHMLALLARWPPPNSTLLSHAALGNAGSINALAWSPSSTHQPTKPSLSLNESDLIAVSLTASGALPTMDGGYGTSLQPTSADFLTVWSVEEALKSVQADASSSSTMQQPVFVGRLEDSGSELSPTSTSLSGLPSNASVHWLPAQPGLVCITQSEGWISIMNLNAGSDETAQPSRRNFQTDLMAKHTRARHASHKVAEAFGEEVDLSSRTSPTTLREMDHLTEATSEIRLTGAPRVGDAADGDVFQASSTRPAPLPQPMPRLRLAPRWLKRPCSASFSFGGVLVWFSNDKNPSKQLTQSSACSSPSPSTLDMTSTTSTAPGHKPTVQLQWIETVNDCNPVSGLDESVGNKLEQLQRMIGWLSEAVCQPTADLGFVCDGLEEFCQPSAIELEAGTKQISPWKILRSRLQSVETMTTIISGLLGCDEQTVRMRIETALKESGDSPSDLHCFCSSQSRRDIAISRLDSLKMALVTADLPSAIRLCLHSSFSGLPCPGISPLSALSVFLATHAGQNELYAEAQHCVLGALNQLSNLPDAKQTDLHFVALLLSALLQDDWSMVAQLWPLEDWSTAVAALVNHTWTRNRPLFKHLCVTLIDRLLDRSDDCTLSQRDRCTAAWVCAVLAGDMNGIVRAWYDLNSVNPDERRGEQLLPLALQLVLVQKIADTRVAVDPTAGSGLPAVAQVFSSIAMWLGHIHAGRGHEDIMVALRLLQQFTVGTQFADFSEVNETAHRLWCALSDEQRQQSSFKFTAPFVCPYQQTSYFSKMKPCVCGKTFAASVQPRCPQTVRSVYSTQPFSPPGPAEAYSGQFFGKPTSHDPIRPPLTNHFPPASSYSAIQSVVTPPMSSSNAPPFGGSLGPTPPLPPVIPSSPQQPFPLWSQPPVIPAGMPSRPVTPSPTVGSVRGPLPPQQQQPTAAVAPPPPPTETSRAWNDPPWLAQTYQPPVRPAVNTNQFYDPSEFTAQLASAPVLPSFSPNNPSNSQVPAPPLASFPTSMHSSVPSFQPSANAPNVTPHTAPLLPLPPMTSGHLQPSASPMFPAITHSHIPATQLSVGGPPLGPKIFPPAPVVPDLPARPTPFRIDDRFGGEAGNFRSASPVISSTMFQSAYPRLGTDQWPAAQPLGTSNSPASAPLPAPSVDGVLSKSSVTVQNGVVEPSSHDQTTPMNPEFAAMEETLTKLVQLCRTVGGKPFASKMDTVDRRIASLFASLRGSSGAIPLSEVVLQHLRECVNAAAQSDYITAVEHANLLIQSASGFESIHSFAPGLKILMQSARQLFPTNRPHGAGEQWPIRTS
ncbi:Protein transport protein Sec31A [Clonorchis sinensis]|uniref:Protein transport protein Sec31A n=1 Tax=Clonorchis sinensis TaxID=79923 RepID=A0A3R7D1P5_CLOSI|nr:Protein transport protein Sec31A [Clonorchis sinensis]